MVTAKPFLALIAADLMTEAVVTVGREMSLASAARLLAQSYVTGAPVVDGEGRCVGVLSATDFLRHAQRDGPGTVPVGADQDYAAAWQLVAPEKLPRETAARFMTPDPVTAGPGATVGALARMMVDAHVHRVVIVDGERHPIGVVSSMDILAAVVQADQHHAAGPLDF